MLADLLSRARPRGRPQLFRRPTATWRRYDELTQPVIGLLPVGDAIATLNPLLGQGISVAAWQARMLGQLLLEGDPTPVELLTRRYLERSAVAAQAAWELSELPNALMADPVAHAALTEAIRHDPAAHRRYVEVWHLLSAPTAAGASTAARVAAEYADLEVP
jgi:flavin-dependent dehydrogenase